MADLVITCAYDNCKWMGCDSKCKVCKNNRTRNSFVDHFEEHEDKTPKKHAVHQNRFTAHLYGTPEQGGIICPACGTSLNPYLFNNETNYICNSCGLPLWLE